MINAKLKLSRIVKLVVQVEFYSILCTTVRYFVAAYIRLYVWEDLTHKKIYAVLAVFFIGCIIEHIRLKIMHELNLKKFLRKCDLWVDAVRRKFSEVFD